MNIGVGEALLIALCGFVTVFLLLIFLIVVIKIISAVVRTLPAISAFINRMFHKGGDKSAAPADQAPAAPAKEEEKPSIIILLSLLYAETYTVHLPGVT